jgi:UDP-N-acetylmuramate dehydrogenase
VLTTEEARARLAQIPDLAVSTHTRLSEHTRFGIGGPADIFAETSSAEAFVRALAAARASGLATVVIGGGTNLVVSDAGFRGIVLRFRASRLMAANCRVIADAGTELQALIDFTISHGLKGLETLAGIPGSVGAAIYGNAGAYGHSISERVVKVRFFDGEQIRVFTNGECDFRYRESAFKLHREWIIFSVELTLDAADIGDLRRTADDIMRVRNEKFPVSMKCAGSIFKNLLLNELPESVAAQVPTSVVREGKVPAAYFLEQVGAKGMCRGDIHVATYHANLIYNGGAGTAADLRTLIDELKQLVFNKFRIELEEEVQYVGFAREVMAVQEME